MNKKPRGPFSVHPACLCIPSYSCGSASLAGFTLSTVQMMTMTMTVHAKTVYNKTSVKHAS
ncbi:hypothetical protein T4D_11443 [Trichinella pseudospiralis]|uniref:Uncharacterized protein n=1 Tax=Trichinella pseudospiralis TaxID=6337 RepID=A0A0V1G6B5_TRIPS|nr:hypothetical protein T4D_11443 [Trichinella pseudospiralis]